MRFTAALVAGTFAVAASAQQTSGSPTVGIDPAQSSVIACIDDCDATDVGCLARCNPVPNPNEDQVEKTHNCISDCDQGDGTEEQTEAYTQCRDACVNEFYYNSSMGTPQPTGGSGGSGGSGGDDNTESDMETETVTTGTMTVTSGMEPTNSASQTDGDEQTSTESGDEPNNTEDSGDDSEGGEGDDNSGDDEDAATGLFATSAAIFGAIAAVMAL